MTPLRPALALLVLLALALPAQAGPTVNGLVHGSGTVSDLTVFQHSGERVEGGIAYRTHACVHCFINLTIATGEVVVVQDGLQFTLTSGTWQVREFQGTFSWTPLRPHEASFRIEGSGRVSPV